MIIIREKKLREAEKYIIVTVKWDTGRIDDQILDYGNFKGAPPKVGSIVTIGTMGGRVTKVRNPAPDEIATFKKALGG